MLQDGRRLLVAADLQEALAAKLGKPLERLTSLTGKIFIGVISF